jgi:aspartate carbamoyltransferase regulatory subunit
MKKELKVSAIQDGTVIDHIPVVNTFKIAEVLKLGDLKNPVIISSNLDSRKLGKKGLIKVGGLLLNERDVRKISILAPGATLSKIHNYKVVEKSKLTVPFEVTDVVRCFNPNCISNKDKAPSKFTLINRSKMMLRCNYCERLMSKDEIRVL